MTLAVRSYLVCFYAIPIFPLEILLFVALAVNINKPWSLILSMVTSWDEEIVHIARYLLHAKFSRYNFMFVTSSCITMYVVMAYIILQ